MAAEYVNAFGEQVIDTAAGCKKEMSFCKESCSSHGRKRMKINGTFWFHLAGTADGPSISMWCSLWISLVLPSQGPNAFFSRRYLVNHESPPNSRIVFDTHNEIHPTSDFCTDAYNESEHTSTDVFN